MVRRRLLIGFVALQVAIPLAAQILYFATGSYTPFGWMMFSTS